MMNLYGDQLIFQSLSYKFNTEYRRPVSSVLHNLEIYEEPFTNMV